MKQILILGASGLIGGDLFDFFKGQGKEILGTYFKKKQEEMIHFDLESSDPRSLPLGGLSHIVLCSSLTNIDDCRLDPQRSKKINLVGIGRVLITSKHKGIIPVFMSGAIVFNGEGNYVEEEERNPPNLYGHYKQEIEDFIVSNFDKYLIIRTGKVFGLGKGQGIFSDWILDYDAGKGIRCAQDDIISVTYTRDLSRGISSLIDNGSNGIYHINPPEHFSRYDLANKFFEQIGLKKEKILPCLLEDLNLLEPRAKKSYLNPSKFLSETNFQFTPLETLFPKILRNNRV